MLNKIVFLDRTWFAVWRNYFALDEDVNIFELNGVIVMPNIFTMLGKGIVYE